MFVKNPQFKISSVSISWKYLGRRLRKPQFHDFPKRPLLNDAFLLSSSTIFCTVLKRSADFCGNPYFARSVNHLTSRFFLFEHTIPIKQFYRISCLVKWPQVQLQFFLSPTESFEISPELERVLLQCTDEKHVSLQNHLFFVGYDTRCPRSQNWSPEVGH